MGAKLSKHFLRDQHGTRATLTSSNDRKPSSTIMEMIKPECLRTKKMKKKKRIQMDPDEKKITTVRKLTLEEWLLASPGGPTSYRSADHQCLSGSSGGELYVFKHFSKKVHPSSFSTTATTTTTTNVVAIEEVVATRPTTSISKTQSGDACSFSTEAVSTSFSMDISSSIMSRSHQSGRLKKRVSFKLPEEADIILFHSPEEKFDQSDYESS